MKQTKFMSLLESGLSTAAGFGISLAAQWFFLPLLGVSISLSQNFLFAVIMTFVSLARQFVMRRIFEALHIRRPLSPFMQAVIAERFRQQDAEGYDAAHDDGHTPRELAQAGAAYLIGDATKPCDSTGKLIPISGNGLWPWTNGYKPQNIRRDLVRGCALGIASGELADRARKPKARAV